MDKWQVVVPCREGVLQRTGRWAEGSHVGEVCLSNFDQVPKWIIRINTDAGCEGLGESLRGEPEADIDAGIAFLVGKDPRTFAPFDLPLPPRADYETFEMAILDLLGKVWNIPASVLLGGAVRDRVPLSYWATRQSPTELGDRAREGVARGFSSIKIKAALSGGDGVEYVENDDPVRAGVIEIGVAGGENFGITIDANYRFRTYDRALLVAESLAGFPVTVMEDPIPWAGALDSYVRLRKESPIPVAIHISSAHTTLVAVAEGAVDYLNLYGPMSTFVRTSWLASQMGISCWHGSGVDLGIRTAAHLHAAAAARTCTLPSDMVGTIFRADDLITEEIIIEGGNALVPTAAGLGVTLDTQALRRFQLR